LKAGRSDDANIWSRRLSSRLFNKKATLATKSLFLGRHPPTTKYQTLLYKQNFKQVRLATLLHAAPFDNLINPLLKEGFIWT